jgi:spore coat protein A
MKAGEKWTVSVVAGILMVATSVTSASIQVPQTPLPGRAIPKFVEPLPTFAGIRVQAGPGYSVSILEFQQKVLPGSVYAALPIPFDNGTYVWGYKVGAAPPSYPGFTVEAQKGTAATVTYANDLVSSVLQPYLTVDQTLHWADPLGLMCLFDPRNPACFQPFSGPAPAVVHLHGAEVPSAFDGGPEQWFTQTGAHGPGYVSLAPTAPNQAVYRYPNRQEAATLWFHDHALGVTRINVFAGLAAFYLLRDARDTGRLDNSIHLPAGAHEIEVVIQDRQFDTNGQFLFPDGSPAGAPSGLNGPPPNPDVHPFWNPEFFGDAIVVNGKTWPFLDVEPRRYRFRLLDGSNARMYDLALFNKAAQQPGPSIWVIGTDGGFLDAPTKVGWPDRLFIAPGERYDVIVDFSGFAGQTLTLLNDAKAPFPSGHSPDPHTTGQILQFRVSTGPVTDATCNPAHAVGTTGACVLRASPIVRLADPTAGTLAEGVVPDRHRQLVLKEVEGQGGPLEVLLNNTRWMGLRESTLGLPGVTPQPIPGGSLVVDSYATELPRVGSTEVWEIVNMTEDAHPIHLHLVQFQLINRQRFNSSKYTADWEAAFPAGFKPGDGPPMPYNTVNGDGAVGGNVAVTPYLKGKVSLPKPNEAGWKDPVVALPGEVTRIVARWAPQGIPVGDVSAGTNLYSFDPTARLATIDFAGNPGGPGYVWHCHILDHEDNEMMRPYAVAP